MTCLQTWKALGTGCPPLLPATFLSDAQCSLCSISLFYEAQNTDAEITEDQKPKKSRISLVLQLTQTQKSVGCFTCRAA